MFDLCYYSINGSLAHVVEHLAFNQTKTIQARHDPF
jgi:predicted Zn-dependent peptidase